MRVTGGAALTWEDCCADGDPAPGHGPFGPFGPLGGPSAEAAALGEATEGQAQRVWRAAAILQGLTREDRERLLRLRKAP